MSAIKRAIKEVAKRIEKVRVLKDGGTHYQYPGEADIYIAGLLDAANIFTKEINEVHF